MTVSHGLGSKLGIKGRKAGGVEGKAEAMGRMDTWSLDARLDSGGTLKLWCREVAI